MPSASRYIAFPDSDKTYSLLGLSASNVASAFLRFYGEKFHFPNYMVETVKRLPWPGFGQDVSAKFKELIQREVAGRRRVYQCEEPFHEFLMPHRVLDEPIDDGILNFDYASILPPELDLEVAANFNLDNNQTSQITIDLMEALSIRESSGEDDEESEEKEDKDFVIDRSPPAENEALISYMIGTAFGRWDIRYATGERQPPELPDPFDPLPVCPPGMLQNAEGLPAEPNDLPAHYSLRISWPGILVDDENHPEDIVARVREAIEVIWKDRAEAIEAEACEILEVKAKPKEGQEALRVYFRDPNRFFKDHLARYSKSRRKAPIYWPLSTDSGSYTLWIYYHRLSDQTLFRCIEMVERKREDVGRELETLRSRVGTGGTAQERQQMEEQAAFLIELKALRDRLHEVTRLPYHPNLNDGVQITAAPLWQCFRHGPWQKVLKETWTDLSKGKYDWAHLAMSIWPDRVEKVCEKDRSIAIAHGREDLCKVPPSKPVAKRASRKRTKDTAPDDAESDLLEDD
jgi:hypothetical protein